MTDRPILFSAPMVRALLDGRKSQTRRVLKPQPDTSKISAPFHPEHRGGRSWVFMARDDFPGYSYATGDFRVPYAPGDRLWVRETWHPVMEGHPVILCKADNRIVYHDTGRTEPNVIYEQPTRWRPSIHMPRWASRLTLVVTDVRVQRVQETSREDAVAEGLEWVAPTYGVSGQPHCDQDPLYPFMHLWDSLNAPRGFGWDANPWVVALTFSVHHQNIDETPTDPET